MVGAGSVQFLEMEMLMYVADGLGSKSGWLGKERGGGEKR